MNIVILLLASVQTFCNSVSIPEPPARETWGFMKDLARRDAYVSHWSRTAKAGELDLSKGVKVVDAYGVTGDLLTATDDLADFLRDVKLSGGSVPLTLSRRELGTKEAYRLEVAADGIALVAGDDEGLRRGIYFLEDRLLASEAPALALGTTERKPWVKNRISRCFFGPIKRAPFYRDELLDDIDYYPEAYLNRLAHEGVNGLWLTVEFLDLAATSFAPRDSQAEKRLAKLRRTVARCKKYGIKTWLFSIEPHRLEKGTRTWDLLHRHPELAGASRGNVTCTCTSTEAGRRYLAESLESIFREVPGLGGLINISHGERPTTCLSFLPAVGPGQTGCSRCDALQPWQVHVNTMTAMLAGLRKANPEAEIISWFYQPQVRPERAAWVAEAARHVPEGVTFLYNFESGALKEQLGRLRTGGDYWLSFTGPSTSFERVAEATRAAGSALGAKIQVGNSHECATVPFVPVPGLLYRKYKSMKAAGVSTVMQCWYFGNYPGVMNKAAGELSFDEFAESEDEFLVRLARPEWGANAAAVAKLWKRLSDAYAEYPLSNDMQYYGPFHAGVAWPLDANVNLKPLGRTWKPLDAPSGDAIGECLENHTLDEAIQLAERMAAGVRVRTETGEDAYADLARMYANNPARRLDVGVMNALALLFESGRDIFRFYRERREAIWLSREMKAPERARACVRRMKELVLRAQEITTEMKTLATVDSRLGYHSEAESHQFHPAKLTWRLAELKRTLADLERIDSTLARGEAYPESDFERTAPRCRLGGDWVQATGFRFKVAETANGDFVFTVKTKADHILFHTFDAAGTLWQRGVRVDSQGVVRSPCADNVVTRGHVAAAEVVRENGEYVYTVTLSAAGWDNDSRLKPSWVTFTVGNHRWPDLPPPKGDFVRLNLGSVRGDFCGRIVKEARVHPQFVAYRSFRPELAETAAFAKMGIPLRAFGVCNTDSKIGEPYTSYPPVWLGRGKYDWAPLEAQVDDFLKTSPEAQFICMVDLNTPRWLARDYLFDSFDTISHVAAMDDWRKVTKAYLQDFLRHVEARYPDRVKAYVLMAGNTTEWFEEEAGRSSRVKNAAWRTWCAARGVKYADHVPAETDLAKASFENVMYDPATEADKIDYWRFHNGIVADALLDFAHAAREIVGTRREIGAFFGYYNICNKHLSAFCHLDYERVAASPDFDFEISPSTYTDRQVGFGTGTMAVEGTLRRYGKRFLHEIDLWPHSLTAPWRFWQPYLKTPGDTLAANLREATYAFVKNASWWWFDMYGKMYADEGVHARIAKMSEIQQRYAGVDAPSAADVLLVCDPESAYTMIDPAGTCPDGFRPALGCGEELRNRVNRAGVAYDICSFNDLDIFDLSRYRTIVLAATWEITPEKARILREKVCTANRTVVWTYAPGVSDGKTLDSRRVQTWAGVPFRTKALTSTEMGGWTSVYAYDYRDLTVPALRSLMAKAGVHFWLDEPAPVVANERFFTIHVKDGGRKTIRLPRRCKEVRELLTDRVVAKDVDSFPYDFASPDTALFEIVPDDGAFRSEDSVSQ